MMKKGREFFLFASVAILLSINYAGAGTWKTLQVPGATSHTYATGVDGSNIVGWYYDASNNSTHGFIYDGSSYKFLNVPNSTRTETYGISGSNIVGVSDFGEFLYNGTSYQFLNIPGSLRYGKYATDIDSSNMVGNYCDDTGVRHGFLYNGSTYSTIDPLGSIDTYLSGISGNNIVGQYSHSGVASGFVYNISTGITTDLGSLEFLIVYGIDGDNILARTWGPHNVLYNLTTHTMTYIDMPGVNDSTTLSISGNKIVGQYLDASNVSHAFVYTIPEPATLLLLGLGSVLFRRKK